ncbi:MAG: DUF2867 domain-containing protein [Bacteroidota bacterium]|jgi:hypothetical protein
MSILVLKTQLPAASLLHTAFPKIHYADAFSAPLKDDQLQLKPIDAAKAFFLAAPAWVSWMMQLRNWIVKLFGIKTSAPTGTREQILENFNGEPGQTIGLFRVFSKSEHEIVMGENDKHLDFRISVWLEPQGSGKQVLTLSTIVVLHNWLGRLYFWPVKFFHRLIVPVMLRAMVRQLESQNVSSRLHTAHD